MPTGAERIDIAALKSDDGWIPYQDRWTDFDLLNTTYIRCVRVGVWVIYNIHTHTNIPYTYIHKHTLLTDFDLLNTTYIRCVRVVVRVIYNIHTYTNIPYTYIHKHTLFHCNTTQGLARDPSNHTRPVHSQLNTYTALLPLYENAFALTTDKRQRRQKRVGMRNAS